MNDETLFDPKEVKDEPQNNEVMNNDETVAEEMQQPLENEVPKEKKKRDFKMAGIAGAAGVAGVGIGVLTPVNLFPDAPEIEEGGDAINENEAHPAPSSSAHLQGHDMEVATSVNDSMNFSQAFAAARHEVGPGGLFVWHGHTYGTYYANEWNAMTPEEQNQYWADVYHTTSHIEYEPTEPQEPAEPQEPQEPAEPQKPQEPAEPQKPSESQEPAKPQEPTEPQEPTGSQEPNQPEPETLQIHEDDVVVLNENDVYETIDIDEDGQDDALIVNVNNNGIPEIILASTDGGNMNTLILDAFDENGELVIDENNVFAISGVEVSYNETPECVYGPPIPDIEEGLVINEDDDLEYEENESISENQDVDDFADLTPDPDITIDNNMGMDEFIG